MQMHAHEFGDINTVDFPSEIKTQSKNEEICKRRHGFVNERFIHQGHRHV
jgi:hypothetical protein